MLSLKQSAAAFATLIFELDIFRVVLGGTVISGFAFKEYFQKSLLQKSLGVIPAEAGIQVLQQFLDPGFLRGDRI
jgi:hypothetical protein